MIALTLVTALIWPVVLLSLIITAPLIGVGIQNLLQKKHALLRNFPLLGNARFFLEKFRPHVHQYFIESDTGGAPISREVRSLIYQRAKLETETLPFGTQKDVYQTGYEWVCHSLVPKHVELESLRVKIGGPQCRRPYSSSIFNISAMSYGSLSKNAILALNGGAKLGGFYHNTGEGGLSPYHLSEGGDLVWQIGTGYFSCRTENGDFCPEMFKEMSAHENVKMIEIKLSQGAKPSHGGILPAAKLTPEIVAIRKVQAGKDVVSPPGHREFNSPKGLLQFVQKLRDLSDGKPIGFKLCIGERHEFIAICKAMLETKILPDFITVDGGEGGTGAAPMEFSNSVGAPLEEGLSFVHDVLIGFDLRKHIRIIASGKIHTAFNIFSRISMGADICNTARGMMMALGCIQARLCNTNHCPTGVATSDEKYTYGLVPSEKKVRVYNYHRKTLFAFADLMGAAGLEFTSQIARQHVMRRVSPEKVCTYADIFPYIPRGCFLIDNIPAEFQQIFARATSEQFKPSPLTSLRLAS